LNLVWSVLTLKKRSFAADSARLSKGIHPPLKIFGEENIVRDGPALVVCNHYHREGFSAFWIAVAVQAALAEFREERDDIHWVMTAAWNFEESRWKHAFLTPITKWAFKRIAQIYEFVNMPPMPPAEHEVLERAVAVRKSLRMAKKLAESGGLMGLAPEGRDVFESGRYVPDGVGDFIYHLNKLGLPILPVGISEVGGKLQISVGKMIELDLPKEKSTRDRVVANQAMDAIEELFI